MLLSLILLFLMLLLMLFLLLLMMLLLQLMLLMLLLLMLLMLLLLLLLLLGTEKIKRPVGATTGDERRMRVGGRVRVEECVCLSGWVCQREIEREGEHVVVVFVVVDVDVVECVQVCRVSESLGSAESCVEMCLRL